MAEICSTFSLQLKLLAWARTFDGGPVAGLWQSVCVCVLSRVCRHCFKVLDDDAIKNAFNATSASEGVAS